MAAMVSPPGMRCASRYVPYRIRVCGRGTGALLCKETYALLAGTVEGPAHDMGAKSTTDCNVEHRFCLKPDCLTV